MARIGLVPGLLSGCPVRLLARAAFLFLAIAIAGSAQAASTRRLLEAQGFDPGVAKRMLRYAPAVANRLSRKKGRAHTYYRGMSVKPQEYDPTFRGSRLLRGGEKFVSPFLKTSYRYAAKQARFLKLQRARRRFPRAEHGVVLELQLPSSFELDRKSWNNAVSTRRVPDDRAFLRRVGVIDLQERLAPSQLRWYSPEAFFRKYRRPRF
jgi:hypothetical protein